jgi:hypothetical protein
VSNFPATDIFTIGVTAETLGKAYLLACDVQPADEFDNVTIGDRIIILLNAALDAAIESGVSVTTATKLAVVKPEPQRRRRAGGKRGGR